VRREAARTWTLDALRAATEPVKVEAMQAMMLGGCCWWWVGCVCGNDEVSVVQRYLCQTNAKICLSEIRDDAFSFALLIVQQLKTNEVPRNRERALTASRTNAT
jgi:hypothetical protein